MTPEADPREVVIREEPLSCLDEYSVIPIAFEVTSIFELSPSSDEPGGFELVERRAAPTYVKDYDAIPGNRPVDWPLRFDLSNWGLLSAWLNGERVGGVVVAWKAPELLMLEGRHDLAVAWDLRVSPRARRMGVGSVLFNAAGRWALERGCRAIKVETQNINVPACRFYANRGCTLGGLNRYAYPELPDEVQLIFYRDTADGSLPTTVR